MTEVETEEQAEARLRVKRCLTALGQAPGLVEHIRELVDAADRVERGELGDVVPLVTADVDDADEVFVRLLEWVRYWSAELGVREPAAVIVHWSRVDEDSRAGVPEREALGFRAGTTPAGAGLLTRLVSSWLAVRVELMVGDAAVAFQEDVRSLVWGLRARYRLTEARERSVRPRGCPECGEAAVGATWTGAGLLDVVVGCEACGVVLPSLRASDVERWLGESVEVRRLSVECEAGEHGSCRSVGCECDCSHGEEKS